MTQIPRVALALGIFGVLPFLAPFMSGEAEVPAEFILVQLSYGVVILGFMSGCIWAFAAKVEDAIGMGMSTIPALFGFGAFIAIPAQMADPRGVQIYLAIGFIALLGLDLRAVRLGQAPTWWMPLRILLTTLVVAALIGGSLV